MRGGYDRSQTSRYWQVNLVLFHFIIVSDALVFMHSIAIGSCSVVMTAPELTQ